MSMRFNYYSSPEIKYKIEIIKTKLTTDLSDYYSIVEGKTEENNNKVAKDDFTS